MPVGHPEDEDVEEDGEEDGEHHGEVELGENYVEGNVVKKGDFVKESV